MNSLEGECEFCSKPGKLRTSDEEGPQVEAYTCNDCWELLKNPLTALPLIRGNLVASLRGQMPKAQLDETVNKFMEMVSKWEPRN